VGCGAALHRVLATRPNLPSWLAPATALAALSASPGDRAALASIGTLLTALLAAHLLLERVRRIGDVVRGASPLRSPELQPGSSGIFTALPESRRLSHERRSVTSTTAVASACQARADFAGVAFFDHSVDDDTALRPRSTAPGNHRPARPVLRSRHRAPRRRSTAGETCFVRFCATD
jgi:hypothetical protein